MSGASHMVTQEVAALAQNRSGLLAFARLAETAERDDDMIEAMTAVLRLSTAGIAITGAERVLFSAAFKAKCSKLRDAHRAATALVLRGESTHEARNHLDTIAARMRSACALLLDIVRGHLLVASKHEDDAEGRVFFLKMVADYERYLAEMDGRESESAVAARKAYHEAMAVASSLPPAHPVLLGLKLNASVFYFEVMCMEDRATRIAKTAFDDAIAQLDELHETQYRDSTVIMQLLRDNLTLWTTDAAEA